MGTVLFFVALLPLALLCAAQEFALMLADLLFTALLGTSSSSRPR